MLNTFIIQVLSLEYSKEKVTRQVKQ